MCFNMQGRVSCFYLCWSQAVSVMGLSAPSPSLIPNVDAVVHGPTHPEDSLPPIPHCLFFFFHFPSCLTSSQILERQILKGSLGLEVLVFCTYFSGRRGAKPGGKRGLSMPRLPQWALQWQHSLLGGRRWIIYQQSIKVLRQVEEIVIVNQILPLGYFCAEAGVVWRKWIGLVTALLLATEMSCDWASQRDF